MTCIVFFDPAPVIFALAGLVVRSVLQKCTDRDLVQKGRKQ